MEIRNIAHRGARSLAPENTIAAARKAFEVGASMWELDTGILADGELIIMHDDTLERTTNVANVFPERPGHYCMNSPLLKSNSWKPVHILSKTIPLGKLKLDKLTITT